MRIINLTKNNELIIYLIIIFLPSFIFSSKNLSEVLLSNILLGMFIVSFINEKIKVSKFFYLGIIFILFQMAPLPEIILYFISNQSMKYYSITSNTNLNFISLNVISTFKYLIIYLNCFMIFISTPLLIKSKRQLKKSIEIILFIGGIHVIYALLMNILNLNDFYFYDKVSNFKSVSGFFVNRNNFSFFIILLLILGISYISLNQTYFSKKQKFDFFSFILSDSFIVRTLIIIFSLTIILTKSRSGNLTFIIIIFSMLLYELIKFRKFNFISFILTTILILDILIILSFFGFDGVIARFAEINLSNQSDRIDVFNFAINQIFNFPLFGYGLGNFETLFRIEIQNNSSFYDHVHNDFIEFAGELGLIGCFILGGFFFSLIRKTLSKTTLYEIKWIVIFTILALLIHGNFDFALHMPQILYVLCFIFSLTYCRLK